MSEKVYPPLVMPDGVRRHPVTVWSNGIALDADVYRPTTIEPDAALPAVVLGHGWGGSKLTAERYAALFASAGMITLTFTQSSWFGSGSPLQLVGEAPGLEDGNEALTRVRFIRNLVDPSAWIANLRAALDYIEGEPNVDPARIGLWGTSFGGGFAVHLAANDDRVKALVAQVPAIAPLRGPVAELARKRAIDTARGDADAIPPGSSTPRSWPTAYRAPGSKCCRASGTWLPAKRPPKLPPCSSPFSHRKEHRHHDRTTLRGAGLGRRPARPVRTAARRRPDRVVPAGLDADHRRPGCRARRPAVHPRTDPAGR
ncbi:alpha/beta hydrolase [Arthrobacter sp. ISL-72]|uniref:alpha/beta hydrolase n=1 Tax=Arthrobacter sp. ISL-72 TaxID=2819114 RepID=UPI001BE74939|nr:dienelactone hydrolase family protein [Arthrobacter sp. ISL-72]MBT2597468.1 dienelactone hydrolase family protein [Arthrobacter sp. ISL-72]